MDSGSKLFLDLLQEFRTFDSSVSWDALTDDQKNKLSLLGSFTQHGSPHATYLWLVELANKKVLADELDKTAQIFQEEKLQGNNTLNEAVVRDFLPNSQERAAKPPTNSKETVEHLVKRVQAAYARTQQYQTIVANRLAHQAVASKSTKTIQDIVSENEKEEDENLRNKVDKRISTSQKFVERYEQTSQEIVATAYSGLDSATQADLAYDLSVLALNDTVDLSNPIEVATALDLIAANNVPSHSSIIADYYQKVENLVASQTPYTDALDNLNGVTRPIDPTLIPDLLPGQIAQIEVTARSLESTINQRLPDIQAANDTRRIIQKRLAQQEPLETSPDHQHLTQENLDRVIHATMADGIPVRSFPTQNGAKVIQIIKKTDPNNGVLHSTTAELVSRVGSVDRLIAHARANPNSQLGKMLKEEPQFFDDVNRQAQHLQKNPLFKDINESFSKPFAAFQNATNWVTSKLPDGIAKPLNVVLHPVQALQNWVGNRIGEKIAQEIGRVIVEKIGSEAVKKVVETLVTEGLKKGLTTLALEVGTALGLDLAAAATGIGLPVAAVMLIVQAAIAAAMFLAQAVFSNSKDWAETAVGGVVSVGAGIAGLISGTAGLLGVATVATTSAASTVVISTIIVIFLYLTSFTIAPILSTLAQLESGVNDSTRFGTIGTGRDALLPPGPLPDSCPQGSPQRGYGVNQGPRVGSHTSGWGISIAGVGFISEGEAIDYNTPMNTPVYATHDGEAYYFEAGDNQPDGYGNYVAIIGSCENPSTGQKIRFLTTYAHLNAGNISRGGPTSVKIGDLIGMTDNSGRSTGPHLHYEIFGLGDIYRYVGP